MDKLEPFSNAACHLGRGAGRGVAEAMKINHEETKSTK
jgi:hypothetical protein